MFFHESAIKLLEWVAPKWYVPENQSFDTLKRKGNEFFAARDYEGVRDPPAGLLLCEGILVLRRI
jgi:hypothetical protein